MMTNWATVCFAAAVGFAALALVAYVGALLIVLVGGKP